MEHVMQQIADGGAMPIAKVSPEQAKENNAPGYEAQGWALAQSVISENMHQLAARGVWNRYVAKLCEFGEEAREAFVKALRADSKARKAYIPDKDHPDHERMRKCNASAQVMISNLSTIAQAMNKGLNVECVVTEGGTFARDGQGNRIPVQAFSVILADAKMLGKNSTGRPALTFEQQLQNFLAKAQKRTADDEAIYTKTVEILKKEGLLHTEQT